MSMALSCAGLSQVLWGPCCAGGRGPAIHTAGLQ